MTEDIQQSEEGVEQNGTPALGWRLRFAREALKLEADDIASELHLSCRTIIAIEEDNYTNIPPIYACGYLRKYARIVNLPEDDIIAEFKERGETLPPVLSEVIVRSREPVNKKSLIRITYAIMAIMAALVVTWWQTAPQDNIIFRLLGLDNMQVEAPDIKVTIDQILVDELKKAEAITSINESISVIALDEIERQQISKTVAKADQPLAGNKTRGGLESPDEILGASQIVVPQSTREPAQLQGEAVGTEVIADQVTITLHLKEDSWIEVTDGTGKRLVYDLYKEGRTRTAQGMPPFKVLLGSSDNVVIEYNGSFYDHKQHRSSTGTARFILGE